MSEPTNPAPPPPPPYGAPPSYPQYGYPPPGYPPPAPPYGYGYGYAKPAGQNINDPAPMGPRLVARIIDGVIVAVVVLIVVRALGLHVFHTTHSSDGASASLSLNGSDYFKAIAVGLVLSGCYEVAMIAGYGATLGKRAMGIRVANIANGEKPSFGAAFIRWVIPGIAGVIPTGLVVIVMWLSPFFDSTHRNRGWYDYAAKTIAVRTR